MKNATLLTITGLLAVPLMFGVNLTQAQNIGKAGTWTRSSAPMEP